MSYPALTSVENISSYFVGLIFDANSEPAASNIANWIDQATATIYGALQDQYVIPITNLTDLKQLEPLADEYVLVRVREVLGKSPVRQLSDGSLIPIQTSLKSFYDALAMYQSEKMVLANSDRNSRNLTVYSFNSSNCVRPVARKNCEQW